MRFPHTALGFLIPTQYLSQPAELTFDAGSTGLSSDFFPAGVGWPRQTYVVVSRQFTGDRRRRDGMKRLLAFAILALLAPATEANAQLKRIAAGYSAVSATQTGFYIAKDAKLFEKY